MNLHKGARTTPLSRADLVDRVVIQNQERQKVAAELGISVRTVSKWVARFLAEGEAGLADRSSRPHQVRQETPVAVVEEMVALRQQHRTGRQIAEQVGCSPSTVSRVLRRARLSRAQHLVPKPPVIRYERATPGELLHLDIKYLGRFQRAGHRVTGDRSGQGPRQGSGWEYVHVAIDDHSRLAHAAISPNQQASSAVAFLHQCIAWYAAHGVTSTGVMTDNGPCSISDAFQQACATLGLKHRRTRPYTPRTNGKAERFIRTALQEWAYAHSSPHSQRRQEALAPWRAS